MPSLIGRREEVRLLRLARSQPATAGDFLELIEEIKERTVDTVLADERVRARMKGVRNRVLGTDFREEKPTAEEKRNLLKRCSRPNPTPGVRKTCLSPAFFPVL